MRGGRPLAPPSLVEGTGFKEVATVVISERAFNPPSLNPPLPSLSDPRREWRGRGAVRHNVGL
jgi:hypothetical protein